MATRCVKDSGSGCAVAPRTRVGTRRRRTAQSPPGRPLLVERLEERTLLATVGTPWADARHLSISFAPDGTPIAGHQSNFFQTLDASRPTADWQREDEA